MACGNHAERLVLKFTSFAITVIMLVTDCSFTRIILYPCFYFLFFSSEVQEPVSKDLLLRNLAESSPVIWFVLKQ